MKSLYDGEEAGAGFTPRFARRSDGSLDTGRPDVGSERVVDVELGAVLRAPRWRLTVNGFWMEFADEIVPSGGLDQYGVPRTGNAERTRHTGIEIDGAVRLARGLDLKANAAWSRNRFVRFTEFITLPDWSVAPVDRAGNPIAGFPGLVANAAIEYSRESLSARLAVAAVGRQYIDNGGGEDPDGLLSNLLWVDAHALVEAGVRYRFADRSRLSGLELQLDVSNMLDARVLQYGNVGFGTPQFFPAATRHAFVGVRYTVR